MLKLKRILFFSLALASALPVWSQEQKTGNGTFHFLMWPHSGGWVDSVTSAEQLSQSLRNAWFDSHLPIYTEMDLQVHIPKTDSLKAYVEFILSRQPQGIEGHPEFIAAEINKEQTRYVPLLALKSPQPKKPPVIVFHAGEQWEGLLGVVHPSLPDAGSAQIKYWQNQTGQKPDWIAFYSTDETIRHFLAGPQGNLNAAALPGGALERFLDKINRPNLLDVIQQVPLPAEYTPNNQQTVLFLRVDLYQDQLFRTVIRETWLRNHFHETMQWVNSQIPK